MNVTETREFDGQDIRREYCPINGRYKLTYNVDDGLEDKIECPQPDSVLDNCPSGSAMNLRFRKCSFENHGKLEDKMQRSGILISFSISFNRNHIRMLRTLASG